MSDKPNCYECKHRDGVPGSAHSRCRHPRVDIIKGPLAEILTIMGPRAGSIFSQVNPLGVSGNAHGIRQGWFNWPYNYDPTWLESCNGFEVEVDGDCDRDEQGGNRA